VERFRGQALAAGCSIAVIANDALGNYVVSTPLLQMLRSCYSPSRVDYYSGVRTRELWSVDPHIDFGFEILGLDPRESGEAALRHGPYDLVVNVESSMWAKSFAALLSGKDTMVVGPSIGPDGRSDLPFADDAVGRLSADPEWTDVDLVQRYPILKSGFIGEIFCRLAYLDGDVPTYSVPAAPPSISVPEVLIGISASLTEKLWPYERWETTLSAIAATGREIGLLGAKPSAQRRYWQGDETEQRLVDAGLVTDLRGCFRLPQVVGALAATSLVLTLDNGILHLAAATNTPTVGLFREGIHRLWAPPVDNLRVITPPPGQSVSEIHEDVVLGALNFAR
jgi:ADP-heptose:LPS heptosyltransferase